MAGRFEGKVVVVTGGANNIGRLASLAFAREGARVMIADFHVDAARDAVAEVQAVTSEVAWARTDLAHEDQILRLRDRTLEEFGRIDVLVNNAAIGVSDASIDRMMGDDWEAGITGNVRHMFLCTKTMLPELERAGGGAIVSTSTIYGVVGGTTSVLYGPVKAGVAQLTRHVAMYYGHKKIRANCVCPGHIVTPRTRPVYERDATLVHKYPVGRLGRMEDIVEAYLFLASDQASFLTGATLVVDGGYTIM